MSTCTPELLMNAGQSTSRFHRVGTRVAGYVLAGACLVWVLRNIQPRPLAEQVTRIHWQWVALAIGFDVLSFVCQGWRWRLLLQPVGRTSVLQTIQAIYVGLFTNEVMPLRVGEAVRAYLISRRLSSPIVRVIPSMTVERLFDGAWLAVGIGVTALFVPLPKSLLEAADVLAVFVLAGLILFSYFALRGAVSSPAPAGASHSRIRARLISLRAQMAEGLREIGITRASLFAFAISSLVIFFQAVAYWLVMWGYGLKLSLWVGTAVFMIVHLGTAIPNAPANVGTYQFFTVIGLSLFGVEKALAASFSVVVFIVLTLPLWVLGLLALARSGTTFAAIRAATRRSNACQVASGVASEVLTETEP